jgi:hypothetical protein
MFVLLLTVKNNTKTVLLHKAKNNTKTVLWHKAKNNTKTVLLHDYNYDVLLFERAVWILLTISIYIVIFQSTSKAVL